MPRVYGLENFMYNGFTTLASAELCTEQFSVPYEHSMTRKLDLGWKGSSI